MFKFVTFSSLFLVFNLHATSSDPVEEAFTEIYDIGVWGKNEEGRGHSGGGSTAENTKIYREFLINFLKQNNIKSVVDLGCGDWEFSKLIDWSNIDYTGFDIVLSVIDRNNQLYARNNINFVHANGILADLPPAELFICKDVLQHLSNKDVLQFIPQLDKYKYCLITNDIERDKIPFNRDCISGQGRPIDLTLPPFNLKGMKVLTYNGCGTKQVLLIDNSNSKVDYNAITQTLPFVDGKETENALYAAPYLPNNPVILEAGTFDGVVSLKEFGKVLPFMGLSPYQHPISVL